MHGLSDDEKTLTENTTAPDPDAEKPVDLRETYRRQLLDSIGGWQGTLITAIAPVVFVIVNAAAGLWPAIISAVAVSVALTVYRILRKKSVQQALSGLLGVVVAAIIAARTGQARGYFLLGIWQSFLYAVPFVLSIPVRRPLVGWLWEFLDPTPQPAGEPERVWYRRPGLLRAYMLATAFVGLMFLARGIVQATLYHERATGWLAFARIAMGYPLFVVAAGGGYLLVRRARAPYLEASALQDSELQDSDQDGGVDGGLGLGQGQEQ